jgi:hypothetical protein
MALVLVASNVTAGPIAAASAAPTGGSLSGTVTELGAPANGVCVYAAAQDVATTYTTTTGVAGTVAGSYDFSALPAGRYDVFFDPTCRGSQASVYASQYWDDVPDVASVTWVTVAAGGTVAGVKADLPLTGTISGTVSGQGTGLGGVCVIAYDSTSGGQVNAAKTAADGSYSVQFHAARRQAEPTSSRGAPAARLRGRPRWIMLCDNRHR